MSNESELIPRLMRSAKQKASEKIHKYFHPKGDFSRNGSKLKTIMEKDLSESLDTDDSQSDNNNNKENDRREKHDQNSTNVRAENVSNMLERLSLSAITNDSNLMNDSSLNDSRIEAHLNDSVLYESVVNETIDLVSSDDESQLNISNVLDFSSLSTDDSTDDENDKEVPAWCRHENRKKIVALQYSANQKMVDTLFGAEPTTPDLHELFPSIDPVETNRTRDSMHWDPIVCHSLIPKY